MIGPNDRGRGRLRVPGSRSKWVALAGGALMGAGVVLLGSVAWQVWGTTVVSQQRHDQVVEQLQQAWDTPVDDQDGQGSADPSAAGEEVATDFGSASAIVRIPALGDDYAVPVLEGTSGEVLAAGLGHRSGTAVAGGRGNYVLAGHRITHGEPLRNMPQLNVGDVVIVETRDVTYTYVLDTPGDALTVTDQDTWVSDFVPVNPATGGVGPASGTDGSGRLLTLITCADFTGSPDRLVAFGHLVERQPRG